MRANLNFQTKNRLAKKRRAARTQGQHRTRIRYERFQNRDFLHEIVRDQRAWQGDRHRGFCQMLANNAIVFGIAGTRMRGNGSRRFVVVLGMGVTHVMRVEVAMRMRMIRAMRMRMTRVRVRRHKFGREVATFYLSGMIVVMCRKNDRHLKRVEERHQEAKVRVSSSESHWNFPSKSCCPSFHQRGPTSSDVAANSRVLHAEC